ncbi:hypothetical protein OGAPHI_000605 [Ogataea philodendri]|uniref:Zn(2)-C6 fungal-type domain-containing protein n=1 Tax=Ogataea philodendri TaxID=1378263 RepID=A0A9P8T9S4_9ASCO|nr:uncharacterized protein OGAPHI_000605 [Ogataea philodendri]KAH3670894.1 hypothetical protein OGAPHI_000605 [Ogataea philodendri]
MQLDAEAGRSPPSDSDSAKKRKRALKACVICHQRKIKCDLDFKEEGQRCTNCHELNLECELYKRKKRIKKFQIHKNLSDLLEKTRIETLNSVRLDPVDLVQKIKRSRHQEYVLKSFSDAENKLVSRLFDEYLSNQQVPDVNDTMIPNMIALGCFNLPQKSVCDRYVQAYFKKVHPIVPILNKESFLRENAKYTAPTSLLLLQTVLYVGSKFVDLEADETKATQSKITNILYNRAKALYDHDFEQNPTNALVSMVLFSLAYEDYYFHTKSLYSWLQLAISKANSHGFFQNDIGEYSEQEQCQIRKIAWFLISKDTLVSMIIGKPRLMKVSAVNIPRLSLDDFRFDTDIPDVIKQYTIEHIRLAEKFPVIDKDLFKRTINSQTVKQYDPLIRSWYDTLPPELSPETHTEANPNYHSLAICSHYYCALISLHHSSIVHSIAKESHCEKTPPSHRASWETIFESCVAMDRILHHLKHSHILAIFASEAVMSMFLVGKALVYFMKADDTRVVETAHKIAHNILDVLKNYVNNWNLAQKFYYVLNKLFHDKNTQAELLSNYTCTINSSNIDLSSIRLEEMDSDASAENSISDSSSHVSQGSKKISIASLMSGPSDFKREDNQL